MKTELELGHNGEAQTRTLLGLFHALIPKATPGKIKYHCYNIAEETWEKNIKKRQKSFLSSFLELLERKMQRKFQITNRKAEEAK